MKASHFCPYSYLMGQTTTELGGGDPWILTGFLGPLFPWRPYLVGLFQSDSWRHWFALLKSRVVNLLFPTLISWSTASHGHCRQGCLQLQLPDAKQVFVCVCVCVCEEQQSTSFEWRLHQLGEKITSAFQQPSGSLTIYCNFQMTLEWLNTPEDMGLWTCSFFYLSAEGLIHFFSLVRYPIADNKYIGHSETNVFYLFLWNLQHT